jgi:MoaA/NifB/PqqE/SkfB family radical SAM enzyme
VFKLADVRAYLPNGVKHLLKPYFRTLLPNQLVALCWITFRCNYRCSYCNIVTNFDFGKVAGRDSEKSVEEWLAAMENLPPTMFFFAGGEPLLYAGFPELLNRLPAKHSTIGLVTNGTAKLDVYRRIEKRIGINVSYHREFIEEEPFLKKVHDLAELFNVSVNIVATRENLSVLRRLQDEFKHENITLHVDRMVGLGVVYTPEEVALLEPYLSTERRAQDDQLDYDDFEPKLCGAGKNYINIMPNGEVYTCAGGMEYIHSPLIKDILDRQHQPPFDLTRFKMGNIFDPGFKVNAKPILCPLPCRAACDRDFTSFKRMLRAKSLVAA